MEHSLVLRGRHVLLEPLRPEHAKGLADAIAPSDDVFRWTNTAPRTEKEMLDWIDARRQDRPTGKALAFVQRDARTGAYAGSTSLFDLDEAARSVEIGHTWIAAPWRRTGLNTEAKLLLMTHAFETLGLARVQLVTDKRNERSRAAIERLGAVPEGILRNWRRDLAGGLRDSAVFSVIDREWPAVKAHLAGKLR